MENKFAHICVDLETLSTRNNAVIVTIAAVKFNFGDDTQESFSVNINPRDSKSFGLHISQDTVDWWKTQPKEAVLAWQHSQIGLVEALDKFNEFCGDSRNIHFWSNGDWFDFPKLEESYNVTGKKDEIPFKYWNVHCMRTAYYLAGFDQRTAPRIGTHHSGLDDCYTQIANLKNVLKSA
jgi:hypothetical protein